MNTDKVYFILGCTACGKAAVGRELAMRLNARILSVDSMKIYRRMNIGTATPSAETQKLIRHYAVDVVEPCDSYSVAQFVQCADAAVDECRRDGKICLAVGGTSLYIKALTEGLFEGPSADENIRNELRATAAGLGGIEELYRRLCAADPESAERIHRNDEKRVIRALEVFIQTGVPISRLQKQWDAGRKRLDCTLIGLRRDKDVQSRRINARVRKMVDMGLRDEVVSLLAEEKPLSPQAAQAVGYAEVIDHLAGKYDWEHAVEQIKINTRRLAKKQRTWHRRWRDVVWFDMDEDEPAQVTT
ncbi:MAG TPA: tRNA (adenosine(37)-N6)-dimethylallyltransferase MiaA, partial [Phycisphaerae bacterium]|nr:tRNA (adenosine(37)-N6)-dimethylallyltransferase MiaA [Phycisphaerae bacterium]